MGSHQTALNYTVHPQNVNGVIKPQRWQGRQLLVQSNWFQHTLVMMSCILSS